MLLKIGFLSATLAFACPSFAQPPTAAAAAACLAEIAELEQGISEARAKGQMLRRRQLAEELSALQAECTAPVSPTALAPTAERAAAIESLEADIHRMRMDLDRADAQLRRLKQEGG
ncbi:MAG: DUF1090 family protein [Variovorax sp.]|nr:MAG: DUF1090 family protein [Variovorax sp.]